MIIDCGNYTTEELMIAVSEMKNEIYRRELEEETKRYVDYLTTIKQAIEKTEEYLGDYLCSGDEFLESLENEEIDGLTINDLKTIIEKEIKRYK